MAKGKEKKQRSIATLPRWWAKSLRIAELHRKEKPTGVSGKSLEYMLKIADLRDDVGDMLDRAGVPLREMTFPAYGLSRAEQKRRAFEVIRRRAAHKEKMAAKRTAKLLLEASRDEAVQREEASSPSSSGASRQRRRRGVNKNGASSTASNAVTCVNNENGVNAEGFALLLENGSLVNVESAKLRDLVREITVTVKAELREELLAYIDAQGRERKLLDALAHLG